MKKSFTVAAISFISFSIFVVTAEAQTLNATQQTTRAISSLSDIVNAFTETLVKSLGTLAMAAAVVAFFYGIVQYIWGVREAKPDVIKTGNQFMQWGLVALFVMFSVYGIIKYGQNILFNGMDVTKITIPELNFIKGSGTTNPSSNNPLGNPPGLVPQNNGRFLCPDGVSFVNSASDYDKCPSVKDPYRCPDGTPYYNPSDSKYCKTDTNTPPKTCGPDEVLVDGECYTNNTP